MPKLNQITAIEKGVKNQTFQDITEGYHALQRTSQLAHPVENHGAIIRAMADVILDSSLLTVEQMTYEVMRQRKYELEVG